MPAILESPQLPVEFSQWFYRSLRECREDIQQTVEKMLDVLKDSQATESEKILAFRAIQDSLSLAAHKGTDSGVQHTQEASFAERLREFMQQRCISQDELATRVGCSQSAISHMLNRQSRPQKKTIMKLAAALQIEPQALWPDLEVANILDTVAEFQAEREFTAAEAEALRVAAQRPPSRLEAKPLPSRKRR